MKIAPKGFDKKIQELFQAVPTDVGICCAFNFNSTMKETVYARWEHQKKVKKQQIQNQRLIAELKQKESQEERLKVLEVKKGKVGFDMGLKVTFLIKTVCTLIYVYLRCR